MSDKKCVWRVGQKLGRTIYEGDQLIGMMDSAEEAAMVVEALNGLAAANAQIAHLTAALERISVVECCEDSYSHVIARHALLKYKMRAEMSDDFKYDGAANWMGDDFKYDGAMMIRDLEVAHAEIDRLDALVQLSRDNEGATTLKLAVAKAQIAEMEADYKYLQEVRGPGTCQCSDDDACMFARQRDAANAKIAELQRDRAKLVHLMKAAITLSEGGQCLVCGESLPSHEHERWCFLSSIKALLIEIGEGPK